MTNQMKFILAIVLQVAIIFAIIIFKVSILFGGTDILLRIQPVDPRDLLRGDYITFQFTDISNIGSLYIEDNFIAPDGTRQQIQNGDNVYVILNKDGIYWFASNFQKTKPSDGEMYIKGKIVSGGLGEEVQQDFPLDRRLDDTTVHIVYGIEEYFIPEGKGKDFRFLNKEASAMVVVDENGNAVIKQIYIEEKPWP